MSKAEKFIQNYTRNCSNEIIVPTQDGNTYTKGYDHWLTPDQALRAVEIAREEIYEWLDEKLSTYVDYKRRGVGESVEEFVNDLRKAMKDE